MAPRFTSRTFGDLPHWERSAPGRLGRWRCHELCCPDVLRIRRISVTGVGVLAIWSQQRPWHPYRESKLGARETSAAICPQPWQKSQKKPCNKLFTSALKRLVGQRRLVQIYLPGRGGTELSCQHFRRGDR